MGVVRLVPVEVQSHGSCVGHEVAAVVVVPVAIVVVPVAIVVGPFGVERQSQGVVAVAAVETVTVVVVGHTGQVQPPAVVGVLLSVEETAGMIDHE